MSKLRIIVKELDITDEEYLRKLKILYQLMSDPHIGSIIPADMVEWCREIGLEPKFSSEDRTTWWTCTAELKTNETS